jgi:hypothetical protein
MGIAPEGLASPISIVLRSLPCPELTPMPG